MSLAMQDFNDVPVMPVSRVDGHVALGGPIWPEFDRQVAPRHCRGAGEPVDRRPPAPRGALPRFRRAAVWGGFLDLQFGHLVAEHLTRLQPSLAARPRDIVLFTLPPGTTPETIPAYVWDLIDWLEVARRRVRLITAPMLAPELRVAAQGELHGSRPPSPDYLDLLDARMERANLPDRGTHPFVFVARSGMAAKGQGGHLGEGYLADLLGQLGVRVFDPAKAPVAEQVRVYFSARCLIFSEGSAVHGRQLLGRLDQDVVVLKRRPGFTVGGVVLRPRCRDVLHHDVCAGRLRAFRAAGELRHLAAAFYDPEALFALFDTLDLPLRRLWDQRAYLDCALADAESWMTCHAVDRGTERNLALIAEMRGKTGLPLARTTPDAARPRLN